ncbi:MAG: hypothetical protein CMP56_03885 [Flavobacteriales bacterium]|jgi:hypothetical protein|nr:hypothetical protein [Flavobacteriales bacterium]
MKSIKYCVFIICSFLLIIACPPTNEQKINDYVNTAQKAEENGFFNDAIEYNDAIVGIQTKITLKILAWGQTDDIDEMKSILIDVQQEIKTGLNTAKQLSFNGDSKSKLKNGAIKLLEFYDKVFNNEYEKLMLLVEQLTNDAESFTEEEYISIALEMGKIIDQVSVDENILDTEFAKLQEQFAKDNGFVLSDESHPLQDMLDEEINY